MKPRWPSQSLQTLQMKTTSNGRRSQNIKLKIWNFPPGTIDFKMEFLRNHRSDHPQSLNLSWDDQTKLCKCFKWGWPPMEDDLTNIKTGISQQLCSNFKLKLTWPNRSLWMLQIKDNFLWKITSEFKKRNISATLIKLKFWYEANVNYIMFTNTSNEDYH